MQSEESQETMPYFVHYIERAPTAMIFNWKVIKFNKLQKEEYEITCKSKWQTGE